MNKKIIISIIVFVSLVVSLFDGNAYLTDSEQLTPLLFTIFGLCLTSYTFIYSPINDLIKRDEKRKKINNLKLKIMLKNLEENMILIFFSAVFIIIFGIFKDINIPYIKNPVGLDFGIFFVPSLKVTIANFFISLLSFLSFYALYDIMMATFKIIRKNFQDK